MSETEMIDLNKRIAALQSELEAYDSLYRRAPVGSAAERYYEKRAQETEAALDPLYRERDAAWGADDDRRLPRWGREPW